MKPTTALWVSGALIVAGALGTVVRAEEAGAQGPLNVILISLDTVRPDHLSCYGHSNPTSPNIDRLADEGAVFTHAFAQAPYTFPSHYAIFSSQYPATWRNDVAQGVVVPSLTGALKQHGYSTVAYCDFKSRETLHAVLLKSRPFRDFDYLRSNLSFRALPGELYRWLSDSREHPFFLFLHGYDAHEPHVLVTQYDAKRFNPDYTGPLPSSDPELQQRFETDNKDDLRYDVFYADQLNRLKTPQGRLANADLAHLKAVYDAQIYYLDQGLGGLFAALKNLSLMDRTIIIILSDHGQAFGEHGEYATHAQLYDEIIRTVLIIKDPRRRLQGARIPNVVQLVDVMPTILELVGLPIPSGVAGRSLVPLLDTGQDPKREEIAVTLFDGAGLSSIRTAEWKLITRDGAPTELYRLSRDPSEQENLVTRYPDVIRQLQDRLGRIAQSPEGPVTAPVDPVRWLQDHGYW